MHDFFRDSTIYPLQGFYDALEKGNLCGSPITGCRFVLEDGAYHAVDSSELAFRICAIAAFRENYLRMRPVILEPVMVVEIVAPVEFQSTSAIFITCHNPLMRIAGCFRQRDWGDHIEAWDDRG